MMRSPRVACDGAHAAEEYGDGNDAQAGDPAHAATVAALEGLVEHLSDGVPSGVIVGAQQVGYVLDCKCDAQYVSPAHYYGDADGADDPDRAVPVGVFGLLGLIKQSTNKHIYLFIFCIKIKSK